jgi:hypothetical protein
MPLFVYRIRDVILECIGVNILAQDQTHHALMCVGIYISPRLDTSCFNV